MTLGCGSSVVNSHKINDLHCFCSLLGVILDMFLVPKRRPKSWNKGLPKRDHNQIEHLIDFGSIFGVPLGVQNGARTGQVRDLCSNNDSKGSQGVDFGTICKLAGSMFGRCFSGCWTYLTTQNYVLGVVKGSAIDVAEEHTTYHDLLAFAERRVGPWTCSL